MVVVEGSDVASVDGIDGGSVVGIPVDSVVGSTAFRVAFTETLYIKKHKTIGHHAVDYTHTH